MQDKISNAIEKNQYYLGIFLDLAKAFDTVDNRVLIKKLDIYDIRSTQIKWFDSHLRNRLQLVN